MDSSSFQQSTTPQPETSRLPAGSVLTLPNGITVPHPHAEANLPGAGDGRTVGTAAILETQAGEQTPLPNPVKLTESQAAAILHGLQPAPASTTSGH